MVTQPDGGVSQSAIDDFHVALEVFEGPFDLLLQLITRKKLDITEVSLSEVTDEFIAHMRLFPDLSQTTEFLVVAATLLDIKAARLLPAPESDAEASTQDLEARDLLFSRLLQYRAFKTVSAEFSRRLDATSGLFARDVPLEPHFAALLPELMWSASPDDLLRAAVRAFSDAVEHVQVTHLHDPVVPVAGQAEIIIERLRASGTLTFHDVVADAASTAVVVSRFLAILELYRRRVLEFAQAEPLAPLTLTWVGEDESDTAIDEGEYEAVTPDEEE